jgi:hypothetical protein
MIKHPKDGQGSGLYKLGLHHTHGVDRGSVEGTTNYIDHDMEIVPRLHASEYTSNNKYMNMTRRGSNSGSSLSFITQPFGREVFWKGSKLVRP